ncbi:MAG TPA: hypothetical protein IGS53_24565 [Leptolyngbyaceae cyanobacterium M33_DOE_097]|uniref:Uncharacterized protein n=1 Tax=Oscillatoriales cyanobacterium SpSt-418 TaxID=2282169 RepID=A0A7C3KFC2_9CYAN|nr:hypothetical protein [Leptolyngbyaceae cyanobacterium M33_DOE_097]
MTQRRRLLLILFGSFGSILIGKKGYIAPMASENQASNDDPDTSDIDTEVHTDFEKAFQAGYSFQYNMPDQGLQTVEFSVHPIGALTLTSGRLMVCDPLLTMDFRNVLTKTIAPGS